MMPGGFSLIRPETDASTRFSALALVVANGLILLAVLAFGWDVGNILLVYWAETGIIGFWSLATLIQQHGPRMIPKALFLTVHFGIFMFVHFMFLVGITNAIQTGGLRPDTDFNPVQTLAMIPAWGAVALFVARGVEAVLNWRRVTENPDPAPRRGRRGANLGPMAPAYARIFVMQFTIIFGAGLVFILGQPIWLLALMIVVKIMVDLLFTGIGPTPRRR